MPDTSRLYALTSTYTSPWWPSEPGPSFLINDPVMAMRWYFDHEQEQNLAVALRSSTDGGATWQALPPRELWAQTLQHLDAVAEIPGVYGIERTRRGTALREQVEADAAEWIDHRIRFVAPDDPSPYRPDTPSLFAWQRGGDIWALALGTVPPDPVLERLVAEYTDPQPEGPDQARAAARETLAALATARSPADAAVPELLQAYQRLELLAFPAGQLHDLVRPAQDSLLNQLATRLPETADVIAAHPDPQHPVRQAAATYLHQLARLGRDPGPANRTLREAQDRLATAVAEPPAEPVSSDPADQPALPGYPRQLTDIEAAAAWRARSPKARRDSEMYMDDLVRAHTRLVVAHAAAAAQGVYWLNARPRDPDEAAAFDSRNYFEEQLERLNAQHSVLMHGSLLAGAEEAAKQAKHQAVVAAAQATLPRTPRTTTAETVADHEAFMAHVTAAEARIDQVLGEQRKHVRDVLHRHFPKAAGSHGMYQLRTGLMDRAGLGFDAYNQAYQAIGETGRHLKDLEHRRASARVEFGRGWVSADDVTKAAKQHNAAKQHFEDLRVSRPETLAALNALDRVREIAPSGPAGMAARAAQITAQSRERTLQPHTPPGPDGAPVHTTQQPQQGQNGQVPQTAPRPGMR
ncbi:hypothetical protein AB0N09_05010 [Streptomyces erythrochromogenes]|uniref:hypothetical protein n=1 Tax=Streptomyces erythrochromogenes TaxID=285574 RepID=UPI00341FC41A